MNKLKHLDQSKLMPDVNHITCTDLFKIYKASEIEVVALKGLDFEVTHGEIVGIVGTSGSGKSTLLNILAGYDKPSAGIITVDDHNLLTMTHKEVEIYRRDQIGFVWQQTTRNLFPYLSVRENVTLPMMLTHLSHQESNVRVTELIELVGLEHRQNHTPEKLSGGEQQRAAIAISLANRPSLLLADEPTGELDDQTANEILDLFNVVNHELGTTILIVTHDQDIKYKVGRVVMIQDGRISTEIKGAPNFKTLSTKEIEQTEPTEYLLVDKSGRVKIPQELLDQSEITDRVKAEIQNGKVILTTDD